MKKRLLLRLPARLLPRNWSSVRSLRKALVFLAGMACHVPSQAQTWRIAPVVGVNLASVSPSTDYQNALNTTGTQTSFSIAFKWQIGAFADYAISERFGVRSGLFYTPKGGSTTVQNTQNSSLKINGSFQMHYLEVPLLVNVAVGQKGFRLVGGPVLGFALSGQLIFEPTQYLGKTIYYGSTSDLSVGSRATDDLLPTETSLLIGLIRERDRLGLPVEIGVYSQIGLSNWNPGAIRQPTHTIRNGLFGLKIAYFFEVGR